MVQLNRTFGPGILFVALLSFNITACCCSNNHSSVPTAKACCCCCYKAHTANQTVLKKAPLNLLVLLGAHFKSNCDCMKSDPGASPKEILEAVQSRIPLVKFSCYPATGVPVLWNAAPAADQRVSPAGYVFHSFSLSTCTFPLRI